MKPKEREQRYKNDGKWYKGNGTDMAIVLLIELNVKINDFEYKIQIRNLHKLFLLENIVSQIIPLQGQQQYTKL